MTYSMQVGMLVGLAAFIPNLLRLRLPSARLAFWQILLVTCLLLPQVRPWKQDLISGDVQFTTTIVCGPARRNRRRSAFHGSRWRWWCSPAARVVPVRLAGSGILETAPAAAPLASGPAFS